MARILSAVSCADVRRRRPRGRVRARLAAARAPRARRRRPALRLAASRGAPTRRASRAAADDLGALIERAEHEYRSRGLRPGFRLTPLTPPAFEPLLRERGYVVDTEAVVMVADELPPPAPPRAGDAIALAPELERGVAARVPGDRAQVAGRAGSGRALGARLRRRRRGASRSRASTASRPRRAMRGSRTTGSTSRPSRRSRSTAGSGSRAPSASASSRGAPSGGARRADPPGRDEKRRRAGALRAARLPPATRLPGPRPGR